MWKPIAMPDQKMPAPVRATDILLAGDILRVVHAGLPWLADATPAERLAELRKHHEPFRAFLNTPPNGNWLVNSCLLYPPDDPGTAGTLFLASRFAFAPFAGTALMAAATVAIDEGRVPVVDGSATVRLDTAVGTAEVQVEIEDGKVVRTRWQRDRPRTLLSEEAVMCSDGKTRTVSLIAAGLPYIVVNENELGVALDDHERLGPAAAALSAEIGVVYPLSRFGIENEYSRYLVMVTGEASGNRVRTVWISDKGEVARSAGGTGALAVLAASLARGDCDDREPTVVSAPGGSFLCQITDQSASVTAEVRISAKHEFFPMAADVAEATSQKP